MHTRQGLWRTSFSLTMARSMPSSSPNSLTMTAMRRPCCAVRMLRTNVDLPAPKKPGCSSKVRSYHQLVFFRASMLGLVRAERRNELVYTSVHRFNTTVLIYL